MDVADRLVNLVAGIGVEKDKTESSFFAHRFLSRSELDALYSSDWLAGSMIDTPCDDLTREWRTWKGGPRQRDALAKTERRLRVRSVVNHALKMARLYGGAAILIGDGAPDPTRPLDPERITKGGLRYLHALSRYEIIAGPLDRDPLSEGFGGPEYYDLPTATSQRATAVGVVRIHASRVVRFLGQAKLETQTSWDGWGLSTLQRGYSAIRNVAATCSNLAAMTYEGKLDIIKIPGLSQGVVDPAYRSSVLARFGLANQMKSINNALILDSEEDWQQKTLNFSNFPEVLRTYLEIAAGAADIPLTRLLGVQSKGMGNSGEQDLRNYYDALAARQEVELRPGMERLDACLARDAGVPAADFDWNPLWQMRESEQATIRLQNAQRDQIYATMGLTAPDALREMVVGGLVENDVYPGIPEIMNRYKGEAPAQLVVKAEVTPQEINTPSAGAKVAKS